MSLTRQKAGKDFRRGDTDIDKNMSEQELQHIRDRQYLIECLSSDLIQMIMEERQIPLEDAMRIIYNSETYRKLEDERTGLYNVKTSDCQQSSSLAFFIRVIN